MRARCARDFREFSPVRGSGPVRVLVRPANLPGVTGRGLHPERELRGVVIDRILGGFENLLGML